MVVIAPRRRVVLLMHGKDASLATYEAVRTADDPDRAVARLQTTYEAAAELGGWDRSLITTQNRLPPLSIRRS
jgi:hypothetical protein